MPSKDVNWSVVYQEAFANAINGKTKDGKINSKLWGLHGGSKSFDFYGMDKNYKTGTDINITGIGYNSLYYDGYYQKVFIFTDDPSKSFTFYIIPVSTPAITFAYFENSENNYQYGDVVKCSVHFHNIYSEKSQDVCAQYFIVENNGENKKFGLEETTEDIDLSQIKDASVWASAVHIMPDMESYYGRGANQKLENTVLIDYEKWRKGEVEKKEFSVIAVIYRDNI
ncbi:hypothetical protein [Frigoriflavimonas asaccharolytica]|uniref:Uncharacterized protein n=1 Tax=Frigoriflavimonas asaccharolytica TaxID=2735899 RepID=A0A8J8K7R3_9FLAO|nr:hypothetical protein [Frigoriflavimonas asaccharolytica]NRS92313.1 hypothetical protein [Frigoriflavimonas asaccharolytica]